jgi:hypothetical protein
MPDLLAQRASAPAFDSAQRGVQPAFQRIVKVDQFFEMRPTQLSPQCGDNLLIGKQFGETHPVPQALLRETPAVLFGQFVRSILQTVSEESRLRTPPLKLSTQCGDNLLAVTRSLLVQHIVADTLADLPVHGDPGGIDGASRLFAGRRDQRADFQAPLTGRLWLPAESSVSWLVEAPTHPTTFPCAHTVHRAQSLQGILIIAWGC